MHLMLTKQFLDYRPFSYLELEDNTDSKPRGRRNYRNIAIVTILSILSISWIVAFSFTIHFDAKKTGFGYCPPDYSQVAFTHCSRGWSLGPIVRCDASSKLSVPYWFTKKPLCTYPYVNSTTTILIVYMSVIAPGIAAVFYHMSK